MRLATLPAPTHRFRVFARKPIESLGQRGREIGDAYMLRKQRLLGHLARSAGDGKP